MRALDVRQIVARKAVQNAQALGQPSRALDGILSGRVPDHAVNACRQFDDAVAADSDSRLEERRRTGNQDRSGMVARESTLAGAENRGSVHASCR